MNLPFEPLDRFVALLHQKSFDGDVCVFVDNKLGHDTTMCFPAIIHPNAAEIYFEIGDPTLIIEENRGLRVGGTVPAIVVGPFAQTPLIDRLMASLRL